MTIKKKVLTANLVLLFWFFLDMIGITIKTNILVTQSYKDDGIFFIISFVSIILFWKLEKIGKYLLTIWLSIWLITQFYFHWFFTIFGPWEGKKAYFADTIKLIYSDTVYIPDLYHIILHLLILVALTFTVLYCYRLKKQKN